MDSLQDFPFRTFHEVRHQPQVQGWLVKLRKHDPSLYEHSLLVGAMASVFAQAIGLDRRDDRLLVTGAILHDVGKLVIPVEILQKAGALAEQERSDMQEHPTKGLFLLLDQEWDPEVLEMVHSHHERLDGSGYPHGLRGLEVGRLVRMVMLCDIFCALIEKRSYQGIASEPLAIMFGMDLKLDRGLLAEFARSVPGMAARAQDVLKLNDPGGVFADSSQPLDSERTV